LKDKIKKLEKRGKIKKRIEMKKKMKKKKKKKGRSHVGELTLFFFFGFEETPPPEKCTL
jgi:hypothetical protein